jgi:hypothetical protein
MKNNGKKTIFDVMVVRFLVVLILYLSIGLAFLLAQRIDTTSGWVAFSFVAVFVGAFTALLTYR